VSYSCNTNPFQDFHWPFGHFKKDDFSKFYVYGNPTKNREDHQNKRNEDNMTKINFYLIFLREHMAPVEEKKSGKAKNLELSIRFICMSSLRCDQTKKKDQKNTASRITTSYGRCCTAQITPSSSPAPDKPKTYRLA
jgi:hypothetical protein